MPPKWANLRWVARRAAWLRVSDTAVCQARFVPRVGLAGPAIPLDPGPLRAALGDRDNWRRRYREFIEATGANKNEKGPVSGAFPVAGAGFEPATSGL